MTIKFLNGRRTARADLLHNQMGRYPRVPPASGVIVNAVLFSAGLRTVNILFTLVVVTKAIPTSWDVRGTANDGVRKINVI